MPMVCKPLHGDDFELDDHDGHRTRTRTRTERPTYVAFCLRVIVAGSALLDIDSRIRLLFQTLMSRHDRESASLCLIQIALNLAKGCGGHRQIEFVHWGFDWSAAMIDAKQ